MKAAATLRLGGAAIFILGVACGHRVGAVELFSEDFDSLTPSLKDVVTFDSEIRARGVWTDVGPTGWTVDNSMMSTIGDPNTGVAEFEGWRFVDKDWWIETAGDQNRSQFVSGRNVIAVADPDEWDDFGTPDPSDLGDFDSRLTTPSIPLNGIGANSAKVFLHSSWRHEVDQKATLIATYNTGQAVDLLKWNSAENDPNFLDFEFKEDAENEALILDLQNPAGASSVQLEFRVFDAGNNWWWAFDNLQVFTGDAPASGGALKVVVDRDSGVVRIVNGTDAAVDLRGFSVQSSAGVFDEAAATFLSDSDSDWIRATRSDDEANDLSELHLTSSQLAPGAEIDFGAVWEPFYQDLGDLSFEYLTEQQDEPIKGIVEFVGNDDESFGFLDLNHNGSIEIGDWEAFKAGFGTDLTGLTLAVRHNLGDLDHDGEHTTLDFLEFQNRFNQANGPGAFAAALSAAPEPTTAGLLTLIGVAGLLRFRRRAALLLVSAACGLGLVSNTAHAQLTLFAEDFESLPLGSNVEEITNGDEVWTSTPPAGWTIDNSGMPGDRNVETENGVVEWYGWNFADKDWWTLAAGDQDRGQFSRGQGTVMIADPDEWDDADGPAREAIATAGGGANYFDSFAKTPVISIPGGVPANRIELAFDSSWRDEAFDDLNNTNNQTATVRVRYDGGAWQNVLTWDSDPESNNFHDDAPNERVARIDLGYDGTASTMELEFGLGNAWNDWWWAVDNLLVSVNPDPAVLRVNTFNGQAFLEGGDVINVGIQSIDIQSENGVLSASGPSGLTGANPTQVDGPDPGGVAGDSPGEQWEMLTASENRVFEAFLYGESIFNNSTSVDLGILMNAGTAAADRDLMFSYSNPIGDITVGIVEYFFDDSVGLAGDFNNDGTVDAADYTVWRDGLGSTYTQSDYNVWRSNYGQSLAAAPSATAAPEPLSLGVLLVGMLALLGLRPARGVALGCAVVACCCLPAGEATAYTLDRDYQFGDDPAENTSGSVEVTFDSAGTPTPAGQPALNQLIDITGYGKIGIKPSYVDIGPLGRPDGGTGKGIRLNQNPILKQYVASQFGEALNFPERSASSTFAEPPGSIDYEIISDRGFQLWTMPSQIPAAGARADIVMDSNQHGVYIDGDTGAFGMRYAAKPFLKQEDVDLGLTLFEEQAKSDYLSDVTAEANTWYHLSVVRPFGPNNGSILYVDGVAVAAATGTYAIERVVNLDVDLTNILDLDTAPLVIGANTGMESGLAGSRNYYSGVVDDLEMFVMGINSSQDFGEYEFARDNGYAAAFGPSVDGDINNDDAVTLADAQLFAANWLYEKRLEWTVDDVEQSLVVGDLESRTRGDFNYDGRVDLADWAILNNANPSTAAAALRLMAGGAVPEPAAAVLITLALAAFGKTRRRGEESQRQ